MPFADLREFIARLDAEGHLCRVTKEVDLKYEIGAICRRSLDHRGPVLLFENVRGHGIPVIANLFSSRERYTWGCDTTPDNYYTDWMNRTNTPVEPVMVTSGPCKEVIIHGDDVDLGKLPIPIWNELDGGPYISIGCHVTKDPESGERNICVIRNQVFDARHIGLEIVNYRQSLQHLEFYRKQGKNLPVAIALGPDPSVSIVASSPFPDNVDEYGMAGALRQKAIELVQCETVPLEVPATTEIVLEGEILCDELRKEGPFGEFTGYYGHVADRHVMRINCITHRRDPIFAGVYQGRPFQESTLIQGMPRAAEIMRQVQLPGLIQVNVTEGGCFFHAIVQIRKDFPGAAKWMGQAILGCPAGRLIKTVILVDEDIDPFDWTRVEWAMAMRLQPHRDVDIFTDVTGCGLDPSISRATRRELPLTSKMVIDATVFDPSDYEPTCLPDRETAERVENDWESYGIPL